MRVRSGITFGVAMLIAAGYCTYLSASAIPLALGVATLSTLAAAAIGYGLGGWYIPVGSERPTFELAAIPLLVSFLAPVTGATILLLGATIIAASASEGLLWVVPGALAMTLAYFSLAWPVIVGSFAVAGLVMARFSR